MESKFYKWSKNGMKMIINTGFITFDKQTNYISTGNVIANTFTGFCIRGYNEVECNGQYFEKGYLQDRDLQVFSSMSKAERNILLGAVDRNRGFCIYSLHYLSRGKYGNQIINFAYIIEQDNNYHYVISQSSYARTQKYRLATDYVVNMLKEHKTVYGF